MPAPDLTSNSRAVRWLSNSNEHSQDSADSPWPLAPTAPRRLGPSLQTSQPQSPPLPPPRGQNAHSPESSVSTGDPKMPYRSSPIENPSPSECAEREKYS